MNNQDIEALRRVIMGFAADLAATQEVLIENRLTTASELSQRREAHSARMAEIPLAKELASLLDLLRR
jgi:hypothetical protein